MQSIYSGYECKSCKKEFVLLTEDVESMRGYLVCPYCNSQRIKKQRESDSLKECMHQRSYKRVHGAIRQR